MGLQKDITNLLKEFNQLMNFLQKANSKYRINNRVSRSGEGFRNFNTKANIKFNDTYHKICEWIRNEMQK